MIFFTRRFYKKHLSHIELRNYHIKLSYNHKVAGPCTSFQNHGFIFLDLIFQENIINLPFHVIDNDFVASVFISKHFSENYEDGPHPHYTLPFKNISFDQEYINFQYSSFTGKPCIQQFPHLNFQQISLLKGGIHTLAS